MGAGWAWGVLALVFLDEVLAVVALAYAGGRFGGWAAGAGVAALAVAVWWALASPKAPWGGPVSRPVTKVLVFGAASAGLWWAGQPAYAVALLAFSVVVNAAAQLPGVRAVLGGATSSESPMRRRRPTA